MVVTTKQMFEEVAQLMVPDASPDALETGLKSVRERLAVLRTSAFRHGLTKQIEKLGAVEAGLSEVDHDIAAARGGDADAGQKAKRALVDVDATMDQFEAESRFPELEEDAVSAVASASNWVSKFGTPQERRVLDEAVAGVEKARRAKQVLELQRRIRQVRQLGSAAYFKSPDAWPEEFNHAASRVSDARDLPKAEKLVAEGYAAIEKEDNAGLQRVTRQLWKLLPVDANERRLGYDSGVS